MTVAAPARTDLRRDSDRRRDVSDLSSWPRVDGGQAVTFWRRCYAVVAVCPPAGHDPAAGGERDWWAPSRGIHRFAGAHRAGAGRDGRAADARFGRNAWAVDLGSRCRAPLHPRRRLHHGDDRDRARRRCRQAERRRRAGDLVRGEPRHHAGSHAARDRAVGVRPGGAGHRAERRAASRPDQSTRTRVDRHPTSAGTS